VRTSDDVNGTLEEHLYCLSDGQRAFPERICWPKTWLSIADSLCKTVGNGTGTLSRPHEYPWSTKLIDACLHLIKVAERGDDTLIAILSGPDFPTRCPLSKSRRPSPNAPVVAASAARKYEVENLARSSGSLSSTEIPYQWCPIPSYRKSWPRS